MMLRGDDQHKQSRRYIDQRRRTRYSEGSQLKRGVPPSLHQRQALSFRILNLSCSAAARTNRWINTMEGIYETLC